VAGAPVGNPHAVPFVAYDSEVTRIGTDEYWQNEFLQVLAFVTLTSFLIFKGSPESRDSDETRDKLDRIEQRLGKLALVQRSAGASDRTPVPIRVKTARD
jgi:hypothetical protein